MKSVPLTVDVELKMFLEKLCRCNRRKNIYVYIYMYACMQGWWFIVMMVEIRCYSGCCTRREANRNESGKKHMRDLTTQPYPVNRLAGCAHV